MSKSAISTAVLESCLEDLERRLLPEVEEDLERQWRGFSDGCCREMIFTPKRSRAAAQPAVEWPNVTVNQAQSDTAAMLLAQLGGCSGAAGSTWGGMLGVRGNYGVGILPSLFGAEIRLMDEIQGNLPISLPMGPEACRRLIDCGVPDLRAGLGDRVLGTAERFLDVFNRYPAIGRFVHLYHPDLQGPMDVVELLWGSDVFTAVYLEPDTIRALLDLVTQTYIEFMKEWERLVPPAPYSLHWNLFHQGRLMLRDDSAMNFSPELYDEFIGPWDRRLLGEFGGGAMHFCGRGDHYIASLASIPGLYAVNLSQPHLNDMEMVLRHTVDKGIKLLDLNRQAAETALAARRLPAGQVQCF